MDVYLRVRRAVMVEGKSIREVSREFGLHRDTVRKMLAYSVPPGYRRQSPPKRPKLEPYTGVLQDPAPHGQADLRAAQGRVRVRRRIHYGQGLRKRASPSDQGDVRAAVHPFEDGNGRIARAITDMALARSQSSPMRLYSVSHRILRERDAYYRALENAALETKGTCDITAWLSRFAGCLGRAIDDALEALCAARQNSILMERTGQLPLNHRQLRALEFLIRSTREEAEADMDGIDGMVRAMLLEKPPRENVNPTCQLARGG